MHTRSPSLDEKGTVRVRNGVRCRAVREVTGTDWCTAYSVQQKYSPSVTLLISVQSDCFVVVSRMGCCVVVVFVVEAMMGLSCRNGGGAFPERTENQLLPNVMRKRLILVWV